MVAEIKVQERRKNIGQNEYKESQAKEEMERIS